MSDSIILILSNFFGYLSFFFTTLFCFLANDELIADGSIWGGGNNGGWMQHLPALRQTLKMAVMCDARGEHPGAMERDIVTEERRDDRPTSRWIEGWRQDDRKSKEWCKGFNSGFIRNVRDGAIPTAKTVGMCQMKKKEKEQNAIICKSYKLNYYY